MAKKYDQQCHDLQYIGLNFTNTFQNNIYEVNLADPYNNISNYLTLRLLIANCFCRQRSTQNHGNW